MSLVNSLKIDTLLPTLLCTLDNTLIKLNNSGGGGERYFADWSQSAKKHENPPLKKLL